VAVYEIRRRLQVCASNRLLRRLTEEGSVVEIVECLDQCTCCEHCCFALVSGTFLYASSPEELCRKILSR
jgi:uncharacterized protein YuzB (UPF0349 family)